MKKEGKQTIQLCVSLVLTVGIFVFLSHKISFTDVFNHLRNVNLGIFTLTVIISIVSNIIISSNRWRLILKKLGHSLSLREAMLIKAGSYPIVYAVPLRVGEFSRMLYLRKQKNVSYEDSLASIVGEYLITLLVLAIPASLVVIIYQIRTSPAIFNQQSFVLLLGCAVLPFVGGMFLNKYAKEQWGDSYRSFVQKITRILSSKGIIVQTLILVYSEVINVFLLSMAIDSTIPLKSLLFLFPFVILISSIPVVFLGLGVREGAMVFLFANISTSEKLLSVGVLCSLVEYIIPVIIGIIFTGVFLNRIYSDKIDEFYNHNVKIS